MADFSPPCILSTRRDQMNEQKRRNLRAGWCALVGRYPWSLFCTFTTDAEWHPDSLERATHGFLSRVERKHGRRWWSFFVLERGSAGRWHVHMVIGGLEPALADSVASLWKLGRKKVEPFDRRRGGVAYLVKQIAADDRPWGFTPEIVARVNAWSQRRRHAARTKPK